jgi:hypothetical protein
MAPAQSLDIPIVARHGKYEGVPLTRIPIFELRWLAKRGEISDREREAIRAELSIRMGS